MWHRYGEGKIFLVNTQRNFSSVSRVARFERNQWTATRAARIALVGFILC
jgi:hypothetical protein